MVHVGTRNGAIMLLNSGTACDGAGEVSPAALARRPVSKHPNFDIVDTLW